MKFITLIIASLILVNINIFSKDCFEGDTLFLNSQYEIDKFVTDFPNCTKLDASIVINPTKGEITTLVPLSNIQSLNGVLIVKNTNLIRLSGLHNISEVGFGVSIENNNELISLTGLDGIREIGQKSHSHIDEVGYLYIKSNDNLKNLWGIDNLDSLKGDLEITDNPNLETLRGLESLRKLNGFKFTGERIEESKLTISNNKKLSICAVMGICFLRNYAEFDFNNNSTRCNSIVEVMGGCSFVSVEDDLNKVEVYPNPSNGVINISSENRITQLKLLDQLGRTIIEKKINDVRQLDISNEPSGVYYLFINNQLFRILKR